MAITPVMAIAAMMTIFTTPMMVIRAIVANKIIMTITGITDSMAITAVMDINKAIQIYITSITMYTIYNH